MTKPIHPLNQSFNLLITNLEMASASVGFLPRILQLGAFEDYLEYLKQNDFLTSKLMARLAEIYLKSPYRSSSNDILVANTLFDKIFNDSLNYTEKENLLNEINHVPFVNKLEGSTLTQMIKIKGSHFYQQIEKIFAIDSLKIHEAVLLGTIEVNKYNNYEFPEMVVNLVKKQFEQAILENNINGFLHHYSFEVLFNSNFSATILDGMIVHGWSASYFEKANKSHYDFHTKFNSNFDLNWLHYHNSLAALLLVMTNEKIEVPLFERLLHSFDNHSAKLFIKGKIINHLEDHHDDVSFISYVMGNEKTVSLINYFDIDKKYLKLEFNQLFKKDFNYLIHYFTFMNQIYGEDKTFELKHLIPAILKSEDFFKSEVSDKFLLLLDNVSFKNNNKLTIYANVIKFLNHQPIQNERNNMLRESIEKVYLELNNCSTEEKISSIKKIKI